MGRVENLSRGLSGSHFLPRLLGVMNCMKTSGISKICELHKVTHKSSLTSLWKLVAFKALFAFNLLNSLLPSKVLIFYWFYVFVCLLAVLNLSFSFFSVHSLESDTVPS